MNRTGDLPNKIYTLRAQAMRLVALGALTGILGGAYAVLIRPYELTWGATNKEVSAAMPDDGIVPHPAFDATRAITIRGRPEDIWPWIAQMGYNRAGFYGYDLIENVGSKTGIRSATQIRPRLQNPQTGDELPISAVASLVYGRVEPNRYLVWMGAQNPPDGVFIWALVPIDSEHTRLISRIRWRYVRSVSGVLLGVFTEFGDHVAVREILRGVRNRAEGRAAQPLWVEGAEITGWLLALGELAACAIFILSWRRWGRAWLLALGAGLVLLFVLYAGAPAWAAAPLPWIYLAAMLWQWRVERRLERSSRVATSGTRVGATA